MIALASQGASRRGRDRTREPGRALRSAVRRAVVLSSKRRRCRAVNPRRRRRSTSAREGPTRMRSSAAVADPDRAIARGSPRAMERAPSLDLSSTQGACWYQRQAASLGPRNVCVSSSRRVRAESGNAGSAKQVPETWRALSTTATSGQSQAATALVVSLRGAPVQIRYANPKAKAR
jgi:hypothetical protein